MISDFEDNGIEIYSIQNAGKSVVADRFIKTLKAKVYKHVTVISKNVYIDDLQSYAKYLEQTREIQQNWTGQEKFDIYFCVFFDCCCQTLISERETGHYVSTQI